MTLLFMDGFDHYGTGSDRGPYINKKWTYCTIADIISAGGRHSTNCLRFDNGTESCYFDFGNEDTLICNLAHKTTTANPTFGFIAFDDVGTDQIGVHIENNKVAVRRGSHAGGGTLLATSIEEITINVWYYYEIKIVFSNTVGSVEIKVNGNEYVNITSQDTSESGNEYANRVRLWGSNGSQFSFDDFCIMNDSGSINNDFLGDAKVETLFTDGDGNLSEWTPLSGNNYENVDEVSPDDDTTYNYVGSGAGLPKSDLYTLDNLETISGNIYGIQPISYTRKDDAGNVNLAQILRTGGTTYSGMGTDGIGDSYNWQKSIVEENPDTSNAWTIAEVNSLETGIKRVS